MYILFIDDDTDDKEIFLEAIRELDPEIHCESASNGAEALELLMQQDALPRYIFLDINMPVMDGKSFLEEMKANNRLKNIPVIIYSTTRDEHELSKLRALGADYIGKPASFEVLKKLLSVYLLPPPEAEGTVK
jgi:CheY-like chemotaxis protein